MIGVSLVVGSSGPALGSIRRDLKPYLVAIECERAILVADWQMGEFYIAEHMILLGARPVLLTAETVRLPPWRMRSRPAQTFQRKPAGSTEPQKLRKSSLPKPEPARHVLGIIIDSMLDRRELVSLRAAYPRRDAAELALRPAPFASRLEVEKHYQSAPQQSPSAGNQRRPLASLRGARRQRHCAEARARVFDVALCLLRTRRRRGPIVFVVDLLVGVRPPAGGEVQEGPHRLDGADMAWILPRLGRREQVLGGPAQPDHPVGALSRV